MADIAGVCAAAITPRREGPEIDLAAAFELLDFLAPTGISGVALLGSTGEFIHFSLEDRIRLVKLCVKRCRVPVIAGVSHSTLDGAVLLGREATAAGAAALLVMPPYFFRYSQEEIRAFYMAFAEQAGNGVPILLYNIPQFTSGIEPETAAALLATGAFAGIKDSSGSWENFLRLQAAREQCRFTLLAGNDVLFAPARMAGADGVVSGLASAVPELLVALDHAITCGKSELASRLDARLKEFIRRVDCFAAPVGVREALAVRGIKTGPHAAAHSAAAGRELSEFREWFSGWLPDMLKESKHA